MKTQLYVPKEIRVGYQNREDTFTKKLAYVIYVDDKGVLRKERSWNSWCDSKIEKHSFTNEPTSGFMLNKNVTRYNWGHFSSNRSYIRVHDPRGFEFEITPENLLGILMDGNCNHRVLDGEFVYSWHGTELVLLPCHSEAYKSAQTFTTLQAKTMSTKDFVPGHVYRTRKQEDYIFVGRFKWHGRTYSSKTGGYISRSDIKFIFTPLSCWNGTAPKTDYRGMKVYPSFEPMADVKRFAECITEKPVDNYASIMDEYNSLPQSAKVKEIIVTPKPFDLSEMVKNANNNHYSYYYVWGVGKDKHGVYHKYHLADPYRNNWAALTPNDYLKFTLRELVPDSNGYLVQKTVTDKDRYYGYSGYNRSYYVEQTVSVRISDIPDLKLGEVTYLMENGFTTRPISPE